MKFQPKNRILQKGFTLLELVVVVLIIGILASVVSSQFGSNVTSAAKATALYEAANKLTQNWSVLATNAGTSTVVASSPLLAASKTAEDVLIGGQANVATAYQTAWTVSGLIPLTDLAQGSAGSYKISNFPFTLGGGGGSPLTVTYTAVPDEIVLQVVAKHGSQVATLAASDTTHAVVRYGTATAGARNLTILKPSA